MREDVRFDFSNFVKSADLNFNRKEHRTKVQSDKRIQMKNASYAKGYQSQVRELLQWKLTVLLVCVERYDL